MGRAESGLGISGVRSQESGTKYLARVEGHLQSNQLLLFQLHSTGKNRKTCHGAALHRDTRGHTGITVFRKHGSKYAKILEMNSGSGHIMQTAIANLNPNPKIFGAN